MSTTVQTVHAAGELREYVVEEVNVRSLRTCSDPLQYCTLRAEPDYPSLGKRLGKGMAKTGKAVKEMSTQQILDFEAQGTIELEGQSLGAGDIRVSVPCGALLSPSRLPACLLHGQSRQGRPGSKCSADPDAMQTGANGKGSI